MDVRVQKDFRLTSEVGLVTLLGAMAGFFVSQSSMFSSAVPNDGFKSVGFMLLYMAVFAGPGLLIEVWRRDRRLDAVVRYGLIASFVLALGIVCNECLVFEADHSNGLSIKFRETYSVPMLLLPFVWIVLHVFDELVRP